MYTRGVNAIKRKHTIFHMRVVSHARSLFSILIGTPQSKLMIMFHMHEHNHKITIVFTSSFASMLLLSFKLGMAKRSKSFSPVYASSVDRLQSLRSCAHRQMFGETSYYFVLPVRWRKCKSTRTRART